VISRIRSLTRPIGQTRQRKNFVGGTPTKAVESAFAPEGATEDKTTALPGKGPRIGVISFFLTYLLDKRFLGVLLACALGPACVAAPVMVQDFEGSSALPAVLVVNIPNENASVQLSTEQPHDGQRCLKLHYHFLGTGDFQYLGVPIKVTIQSPVHILRFWLKGDNQRCSYGVRLTDASGETHQYSKNSGQTGIIDFTGWREILIDLDSGHETWGGDKNGKIDYPITEIAFTLGQPTEDGKRLAVESDLFVDSFSVDDARPGQISVVSPEYCSDVKGDCDNVEVGRHNTLPLSKERPFFFLINLATGGGWPVDLSRYHGLADMYIDFVRVYAQSP
jgi:hypothetical protein